MTVKLAKHETDLFCEGRQSKHRLRATWPRCYGGDPSIMYFVRLDDF